MKKLKVAKDFHRCPGGRYRSDGKHSAQEFREEVLELLFIGTDEPIEIDLDGGAGYASSFLEEAFGGLARRQGRRAVQARLQFISDEQPYLIDDIKEYIDDVREETPKRPCNKEQAPQYPTNGRSFEDRVRLPGRPLMPGAPDVHAFCPKKCLPEDNGIVFIQVTGGKNK